MKIVYAAEYGFCMGVTRAVKIMDSVLSDPSTAGCRICTVGPLIHNEIFMDSIKRRGVRVVRSVSEIAPGDVAVTRTHGLPPNETAALQAAGARIIDATCPKVLHSRHIIEDFCKRCPDGWVVIAGDRNHGEVNALCGFAKRGAVVQNAGEAAAWAALRKAEERRQGTPAEVLLLAQTTFNSESFRDIDAALQAAAIAPLQVCATICRATQQRQSALRALLHLPPAGAAWGAGEFGAAGPGAGGPEATEGLGNGDGKASGGRGIGEPESGSATAAGEAASPSDVRSPVPDVVCVIGGRQSANTRRLVEIAEQAGFPTYPVQSADDFPAELLARLASEPDLTVGITAGASTPNWVIEEVAQRLRRESGVGEGARGG